MGNLIQQGVNVFKAGDSDTARKLLTEAVKQFPDDERAWGWMYNVSTTDEERISCLKQIIRINPQNEKANELLKELLSTNPHLENTQLHNPGDTGIDQPDKFVAIRLPQSIENKRPQKEQKAVSQRALILLGGIGLLLILCIGAAIFGSSLIRNNLPGNDKLASGPVQTQIAFTPSRVIEEVISTITPRPVISNSRTPRPSFTPYPTNTLFVISTWTPTKISFTQIPSQIPNLNPIATIKNEPTASGGNQPKPTKNIIPTQRIAPSLTPKPNITISCEVSPSVIGVGTNTTLNISAQLYQDGKAISTIALVAEWQDYQHRNFHCTSTGNTCQGQSGYMVGHSQSIIKIGVNSANGQRFDCQTTYRTP